MKCYMSGHMAKGTEEDWRDYIINRIEKEYNNSVRVLSKDYTIKFLVPRDKDLKDKNLSDEVKHNALATGDRYQMNICDVAVVNLDLKLGSCLGTMLEMGILVNMAKPIILINNQPDLPKTKFVEHNASVVVYNMDDVVDILIHMVQ